MLSDRCHVCPSCLSVWDVGVLWPNGWMDQDETWHRPHCVRWGPSSSKKGHSPPNFRPMSVVAKRLDGLRCHLVGITVFFRLGRFLHPYHGVFFLHRGRDVDLGPGDIVLDGDPALTPSKGTQSPIFGPCLLWPNGRPSQLLLNTCKSNSENCIKIRWFLTKLQTKIRWLLFMAHGVFTGYYGDAAVGPYA